MKRADCWMTFSEALEQYLDAREVMGHAPTGCRRWEEAQDAKRVAAEHMDALTGDES